MDLPVGSLPLLDVVLVWSGGMFPFALVYPRKQYLRESANSNNLSCSSLESIWWIGIGSIDWYGITVSLSFKCRCIQWIFSDYFFYFFYFCKRPKANDCLLWIYDQITISRHAHFPSKTRLSVWPRETVPASHWSLARAFLLTMEMFLNKTLQTSCLRDSMCVQVWESRFKHSTSLDM